MQIGRTVQSKPFSMYNFHIMESPEILEGYLGLDFRLFDNVKFKWISCVVCVVA